MRRWQREVSFLVVVRGNIKRGGGRFSPDGSGLDGQEENGYVPSVLKGREDLESGGVGDCSVDPEGWDA